MNVSHFGSSRHVAVVDRGRDSFANTRPFTEQIEPITSDQNLHLGIQTGLCGRTTTDSRRNLSLVLILVFDVLEVGVPCYGVLV